MSVKELKALERRFFEELNKGKAAAMAVIDELCATDFVWHPGTGRDIRNLKDYKQFVSENYSTFPDVHSTVDDMVAEGDKVVVRFTFTGTHKGEWRGIPPTNRRVTGWGISIDRIAGGKFVESWERYDTLGWM
jgi:predicted ester cyclase